SGADGFNSVTVAVLLAFLILAAIPVFSVIFGSSEAIGIGLLICVGLGLPAAAVFFALAAWVAAKV
ncbi:MAG TPA: hypothetical protein PK530_22150, partial [Anaerolineales bacterium]|nr:hypothetical protein [Anaerolineales bacterium]